MARTDTLASSRRIGRPGCGTLPLLATVIGLAIAAPSAMAATRHVSPGGADGAPCTQQAPCQTLGRAHDVAAAGDVVQLAAGVYPAQETAPESKAVTFRGAPGTKLRELDNHADNVTFDGIEVDAGFARVAAFENHDAANVTFQNGRIGNVTDEKGALVSGTKFTFDNVGFHDVLLTNEAIHNECVYAIGVPGMTVRNSTFHGCATMDLFFTYGDWWTPTAPAYGAVTIENNVFAHSTMEQSANAWHYYSLYVGNTGPGGGQLTGWVVRNNTFEISARVSREISSGSRWVGNLGSWDCVDGVTFRHNVGKKCAATDTAITPDASTRAQTAPFGWISPQTNDFRLRAGSPAIGAADPGDAPATDRDGARRDSAPDAGAYEYGAGAASGVGPGAGAPGAGPGGAPGSGGRSATSGPNALAVRSKRLAHRTICRTARRRCPSRTSLRIRLSAPGAVTARIERLQGTARSRRARTVRLANKVDHLMRIRARSLGAGRYRIVIVATGAGGQKTKAQTVRLRVR